VRALANDLNPDDCLIEGLNRVASVIDGIVDFDPIIGHKVPPELRLNIDGQADRERACSEAVSYTLDTLRAAKPVVYSFPDVDILLFGKTQNNLREFKFILPIIDEGGIHSVVNVAELTPKKKDGIATALAEKAAAYEQVIAGFFRNRHGLTSGLVFQIAQYVVSYTRFCLSLQPHFSAAPRIAIVANDHSPASVAFAQAMKQAKISRLYVQHAEVASSFPPLNFEYSVLRNEKSKRIYENIGNVTGEVYVISRFREGFVSPLVPGVKESLQTVALYTTGRVDSAGLSRVVKKLQDNPYVEKVLIKAHPNQGPVEWPPGVQVVQQAIVEPHIAIVGNSSVTIELLQRGVPTFQNFDFDPVEADYYGFVRDRIATLVTFEALGSNFWSEVEFGSDWYDRFADAYSPREDKSSIDSTRLRSSVSVLLHKQQSNSLSKVSYPKSSPKPSAALAIPQEFKDRIYRFAPSYVIRALKFAHRNFPVRIALSPAPATRGPAQHANQVAQRVDSEWVHFSLATSKNPVEWLRRSLSLGLFTTEHAVKALESLYVAREAAIFDLFEGWVGLRASRPIFAWLAFKRFEVSGVGLPASLGELVQITLEESNIYVRSRLETLAFNACLRSDDLDSLNALMAGGNNVNLDRLSTTQRVALLRHYAQSGRKANYDKLKQRFWDAETPLHRLKITALHEALFSSEEHSSHREIELKFAASVNSAVLADYRKYVEPVYNRMRSEMRFMDVRISPKERENFYELVTSALRDRRALSMIRLGDGEAYALSARNGLFTEADRANRERHWWGVELSAEKREEISNRVRLAVSRADVLGIPSVHRFVRDTLDKSKGFSGNIQGRGLAQVLSHLTELESRPLVGEDRMNLALFRSGDAMHPLLSAAERCVVVSSAAVQAIPQWMHELTDTVSIQIPTHLRTSRNQKYASSTIPLPNLYEQIDAEVREKVAPGTLVLVAGGIVGKIFIDTARTSGAVALDLGSVMDEWVGAGIHSLH
jgi:hypothetical protein